MRSHVPAEVVNETKFYSYIRIQTGKEVLILCSFVDFPECAEGRI